MHFFTIINLFSAAYLATAGHLPPRNYATHDYYAVHLAPSTSPAEFAASLNLTYDGPLGALSDHHVFKAPKHNNDIVDDAVQELKRRRRKRELGSLEAHPLDGVQYTQKQKIKPRHWKRSMIPPFQRASTGVSEGTQIQREIANKLRIVDPIFEEQWHLFNTGTRNDLNVTDLWLEGITGKNVTACIVDDGLDMDSDDLKANFFAKGSYDFNDHVDLPKPRLVEDRHGTRCAGEVAAGRNNA